jgi:uncharacterized membrane protein (UPF0182 family)
MRVRASHPRALRPRAAPVATGRGRPAPEQPTAPGKRWWRRPRLRSTVLLGALGAVAVAIRMAAHLETDWMWFHELGQERVFWTLVASRSVAGGVIALATIAFLLVNLWVVERSAPDRRAPGGPRAGRRTRTLLWALVGACIGAGVLIGRSVVLSDWQRILLWLHRSDFGITDPLFHRDVGFFVFSLPLYRNVVHWLLLITAIALVCAAGAHAATGAIRVQPSPIAATRAARAHLLVLGALLLVLVAWQHRLSQFAAELPGHGRTLPGAGYTEVHVELPWLRVLTVVALAGAAMFVYAAVRRSSSLPAVAVAVVAVAELVNPAILPTVVQRFLVDPQTLSRERPYIKDAVAMTRHAYGLDRVATRPLPANPSISGRELRANRDVLDSIQLWDTDVLRPEIAQQQAIGSYYAFPGTTVDRYRVGAKPQGFILAERELDLSRLSPAGRTWANDRLAYTHGYGLVAVPAGDSGVDAEGKPRFATSEFGAGKPPTRVRQPRLYYGVQPREAQPWVIVGTHRAEVEKPLSGDTPEPRYHYDGPGGIPIPGLFRRGLFALRFGDLNLVLSETLGAHPRILLHRDVRDRLRTLAPFLHWEQHPQVAVVDGRVVFLTHGYTTSDSFPYSAPVVAGGRRLNYVRSSVVAAVDAFSGSVTMYATDPGDPILRAWRGVFPSLFLPAASMPPDVRAHLRYPRQLFAAQARIWATYHIADIDDFYTKADAWKRPADVSGPIQRVGGLRTRPAGDGATPRMAPAFVVARLPGERRPQFMLTSAFTPYSEENLSGYLAGTVDAHGRARLTQLSLPRSRRVLGPSQVSRQILATPGVNDTLRLLNQETTDLGDRAVNIVEISDPRVVPVADSFLYVQTIYVTAKGTGVTRMRLVTAFLNGRVGYGKTLDDALRRAGAPRR